MKIEHLERTQLGIEKLQFHYEWLKKHRVPPKPFLVTKLSPLGEKILGFQTDRIVCFQERFYPQKEFPGRVTFNPSPFWVDGLPRYVEIKGYGIEGGNITLLLHNDGDVLFGMFYKNAKKEYRILEKATEKGLHVPQPLALGKFDHETVVESGLRNYAWLITKYLGENQEAERIEFERLRARYQEGITSLENYLGEKRNEVWLIRGDPLEVLKQPYSLGIVVRGPMSPIRLGDPAENYPLTESNIAIARQSGHTFMELLKLGYLHLSPGTGNWTLAGELTDMSDCYAIRKDKNLKEIIRRREKEVGKNFWQDLIGPGHTSESLYPFFIEGMFGGRTDLKEAARELESLVRYKFQEQGKEF